ncbi:unnamed protein product [Blepharisma stoltei]|uniref:C2 domain-containing protein n=1 Tax=Blepharisma stoltei TaxID=1481888 RepID=A0AAU9INW9_9CILI|nr:unnamed protein product [Blepharisma stoltei]
MAQQLRRGNLIVRPISAKLIKDKATGTMDPYVLIRVGPQEQKTNYCKNGGKVPNWNEQLNFSVSGEDQIHILVYDKRTLAKDKELGAATLPLMNVISMKQFEDWVDLIHKGSVAGQIRLQIVFNEEFLGAGQGVGQQGMGQHLPQQGY